MALKIFRFLVFLITPPSCWFLSELITKAHNIGGPGGLGEIGRLTITYTTLVYCLILGKICSLVFPISENSKIRRVFYALCWIVSISSYYFNNIRFSFFRYYGDDLPPHELDGWLYIDTFSLLLFSCMIILLFFLSVVDTNKKLLEQAFIVHAIIYTISFPLAEFMTSFCV